MTYYPTRIYYQCAALPLVAFALALLLKARDPVGLASVAIIPATIIALLHSGEHLRLEGSKLTYRRFFGWLDGTITVDLAQLTNCRYYRRISRGSYYMQFHLYDAAGGSMDVPANIWSHRNTLFAELRQAVISNNVEIDKRTKEKLKT